MRWLFLTILIAVSMSACSYTPTTDASNAQTPDVRTTGKDGNGIVEEYLRRDASPLRKQRVRFTITSEDDPVKVYEIETWRKQAESETATLTQIVKPAEDTDLASLTIEKKGEPARVTAFIASQNEFRETDTNKMFFGGLTAGELLGQWDKFDFKRLGEKDLNGARVYELEGKVRKGESGTVARMLVLMRAAEPIPVELQLFDSGNRHLRTYKVIETRSDTGGAYAVRTEIDNPIYKTKVVVEILSREFPEKVDDATFTRDKLKEIATRKK